MQCLTGNVYQVIHDNTWLVMIQLMTWLPSQEASICGHAQAMDFNQTQIFSVFLTSPQHHDEFVLFKLHHTR